MEIRPALKADIRALAELWADAFPGERTVEQRVRQLEAGGVYGGIDTAFIATADGSTAGAFRAYRMQQHMHGATLPMLGVAAVAVAPGARRHGLGTQLCRLALRHAYDRGDVLSVLYPFRPSFYEALGWGLVGSFHSFRFAPESIRVTHALPRVRAVADAVPIISPCYDAVAAQSNGLIARTSRIWRQHLDWPDVNVYVLERDGACAGYIIAHHATSESLLTIRELVALDCDAYNELLSWISLQRGTWRLVHYDAMPSERFDLRLTEPRTPGGSTSRPLYDPVAKVIRGPMLRIVNVAESLTRRAEWGLDNFVFALKVTDGEIVENESPKVVTVEGGIARVAVSSAVAISTIATDSPTFAQIYAGEITPGEAQRLGRARLSGDTAAMNELFRPRTPFRLLDEF